MCTGSAILAQTFQKKGYENILAVDINNQAVTNAKKQKIKAMQSNLFSKIKNKKFDLIVCNPPYLPTDPKEPIDSQLQTTAGKKGYELIIKFLTQAKNHLNPDGKILLLFSSLSKPKIILSHAKNLKYEYKLLATRKLFFEELFVYEFSRK